jgi:hypothetical protein
MDDKIIDYYHGKLYRILLANISLFDDVRNAKHTKLLEVELAHLFNNPKRINTANLTEILTRLAKPTNTKSNTSAVSILHGYTGNRTSGGNTAARSSGNTAQSSIAKRARLVSG